MKILPRVIYGKVEKIKFYVMLAFIFLAPKLLYAQSLQGRILATIDNLITIVNLLLIGAIVWAGFLMAKGDGSGVQKLVYSIVGLIVVNSSRMIVEFFTP
jgi:hypothetical protein